MNLQTEKILALIRDNSYLPFYVFINCDNIDTYSYSSAVQEITDIDVGYIWSDDDNNIYWDVDDVANDFYDNMTDEWLEEHGFDTDNMSNEDYDRLIRCVLIWPNLLTGRNASLLGPVILIRE